MQLVRYLFLPTLDLRFCFFGTGNSRHRAPQIPLAVLKLLPTNQQNTDDTSGCSPIISEGLFTFVNCFSVVFKNIIRTGTQQPPIRLFPLSPPLLPVVYSLQLSKCSCEMPSHPPAARF